MLTRTSPSDCDSKAKGDKAPCLKEASEAFLSKIQIKAFICTRNLLSNCCPATATYIKILYLDAKRRIGYEKLEPNGQQTITEKTSHFPLFGFYRKRR